MDSMWTLADIHTFAKYHLPTALARLPAPQCFTFHYDAAGRPRLLIGESNGKDIKHPVLATMDFGTGAVGYLLNDESSFDGRNIHLHELSSWLHPLSRSDDDDPLKLEVFIQYCFLAAGHTVPFNKEDKMVFNAVCEVIVAVQDAKNLSGGLGASASVSTPSNITKEQVEKMRANHAAEIEKAMAEVARWKEMYKALPTLATSSGDSGGECSDH